MIKKQTIVVRVPPPPRSSFNPAAEKAPPSAMFIWELLRRNPDFRRTVQHLELFSTRAPETTGAEFERRNLQSARRYYRRLCSQNTFAACATLWVFRGWLSEIRLHRVVEHFFTDWPEHEWFNFGIPWIETQRLKKLERLIKADRLGHTCRAPLRALDGKFNLNTPWPKTPPLFRFHFDWLWDEFVPFLDGAARRTFVPLLFGAPAQQQSGEARCPVDWSFLDIPGFPKSVALDTAVQLDALRALFDRHHVFAIPKMPLTKAERSHLVQNIRICLEAHVAASNTGIRTKVAGFLFGSPEAWRDFAALREFICYSSEAGQASTPAQRDIQFKNRAKVLKPKQRANLVPSIRQRYEQIEALMRSVYPRFAWPEILQSRCGIPKEASEPAFHWATKVCRRKLNFMFGFLGELPDYPLPFPSE
jgi:hypothetical protein